MQSSSSDSPPLEEIPDEGKNQPLNIEHPGDPLPPRHPDKKTRRINIFRVTFLLVLGVAALFVLLPAFHLLCVGALTKAVAFRQGVNIAWGTLEGRLWGALEFQDLVVGDQGEEPQWQITTRQATVNLNLEAWWSMLLGDSRQALVERVALNEATIHLKMDPRGDRLPIDQAAGPYRWYPSELSLKDSTLEILALGQSLNATAFNLEASTLGGQLTVGELAWNDGASFKRTGLSCKALWEEGVFYLSELELEQGLRANLVELDLSQFLAGELALGVAFQGFGGTLRFSLRVSNLGRITEVEGSGSGGGIDLSLLGASLQGIELSSGRLENFRLSYRGPLLQDELPTAAFRAKVVDFEWQDRSWDSLILGATLASRRLQIQTFQLRQPGNTLDLSGESSIPTNLIPLEVPDFNVNVQAELTNLEEVSKLLPGREGWLKGKLNLSGTVERRGETMLGDLELQGQDCVVFDTEFSTLHSDVSFQGGSIELRRLELIAGEDHFRAHGELAIDQPWGFVGEIELALGDIATYQAWRALFPQMPSYLKNATLWWSGDGTLVANSGALRLSVEEIRLREEDPPLELAIEGTYRPGHGHLSRLSIMKPGHLELAGAISWEPQSIQFEEVTLVLPDGQASGNLTLPIELGALSVWPDWKSPWRPAGSGPIEGDLSLENILLSQATTWNLWPEALQDFRVSGELKLGGALNAISWTGRLDLVRDDEEARDASLLLQSSGFEADTLIRGSFQHLGTPMSIRGEIRSLFQKHPEAKIFGAFESMEIALHPLLEGELRNGGWTLTLPDASLKAQAEVAFKPVGIRLSKRESETASDAKLAWPDLTALHKLWPEAKTELAIVLSNGEASLKWQNALWTGESVVAAQVGGDTGDLLASQQASLSVAIDNSQLRSTELAPVDEHQTWRMEGEYPTLRLRFETTQSPTSENEASATIRASAGVKDMGNWTLLPND